MAQYSVLSTVESCKEQQSVERKHPTAKQNKLSQIKKKKKQSVERRHPADKQDKR